MHVFRALIPIALATALMSCGQGQPGPKGDPGPPGPPGAKGDPRHLPQSGAGQQSRGRNMHEDPAVLARLAADLPEAGQVPMMLKNHTLSKSIPAREC